MSYPSIEVSEHSAKQSFLYLINGADFQLAFTNAQKTISVEIDGTTYDFKHPLGGVSHTEPLESQDARRTGLTLTVSLANTLYRKHKEFPPHGNTTLVIYRQNEIDGDPYQIWSGTIWSPLVVSEEDSIEVQFECLTDQETMARAEGVNDTFQALCNWFLFNFPCPVNRANWKVVVTVEDIDNENFTVTVSGADDKIADWFKIGYIEAPNGDKRTILADAVVGLNHVLTLQQNFPSTTLRVNDSADAYPGCDRARTTGRDKFGSETGNGAGCGTNDIQTNVSPHEIGRLQ